MPCTTVLRSRIGTAASSRQPSWRRSISCSNCRIGSRKRSSSCSIRPSISWGSESPTPTHATRIPRRALARRGISRYNEGLKMAYRLLADAVVLLHTAFVAFVVLGGFLAWRWSRIAWLHVPCALWGAVIEYQGWICPLTPLENDLRRRAGLTGYAGGFVEHYVLPVLYPAGLTRPAQALLGTLVVIVNLIAYGVLLRRALRGG